MLVFKLEMNKAQKILLGLNLLIGVLILLIYLRPPNSSRVVSDSTIIPNRNDCEYGVFDYNYDVYVVKPGDNITSVANNKLGDIKRAGEIILLNKSKYPTLLTRPEYLERNWALKLPPLEFVINSERQMITFKGHIHENSSDHFRVSVTEKSSNTHIYDSKNTSYLLNGIKTVKQQIPNGACFEADIENTGRLVNSIREIRVTNVK